MAFATCQMERSLAAAPAFARHVKQLAALRKRTAGLMARSRFRDRRGLSLKGCEGYVYEGPAGSTVVLAETNNGRAKVRASLACDGLGRGCAGKGLLYRSGNGMRARPSVVAGAGRGEARLSVALDPLEVAVWHIPHDTEARK